MDSKTVFFFLFFPMDLFHGISWVLTERALRIMIVFQITNIFNKMRNGQKIVMKSNKSILHKYLLTWFYNFKSMWMMYRYFGPALQPHTISITHLLYDKLIDWYTDLKSILLMWYDCTWSMMEYDMSISTIIEIKLDYRELNHQEKV